MHPSMSECMDIDRRLHATIDSLSNNCRERNRFISLLKRYSLEETMRMLNWSEDRKQLLRSMVAEKGPSND